MGTVITAIGYRAAPIGDLPFDAERGVFVNDQGRIEEGLFVVGWAKRGPSGVIATNRADSLAVAEKIAAMLAQQAPKRAPDVAKTLADRATQVIDFAAWQNIERAEAAAGAVLGRPRSKFPDIVQLLHSAR